MRARLKSGLRITYQINNITSIVVHIDIDETYLCGYRSVTNHKHPLKTLTEGDAIDLLIILVLNEVQVGLRSD